jgi:hypothetical protein
MRQLALFYVGKYATTQAKLSGYLARKTRERGWDDERPADIAALNRTIRCTWLYKRRPICRGAQPVLRPQGLWRTTPERGFACQRHRQRGCHCGQSAYGRKYFQRSRKLCAAQAAWAFCARRGTAGKAAKAAKRLLARWTWFRSSETVCLRRTRRRDQRRLSLVINTVRGRHCLGGAQRGDYTHEVLESHAPQDLPQTCGIPHRARSSAELIILAL